MRIVRFTASNFKCLKAVEIVPGDASTVVISGPNGAGKSSILDAIAVAVAGKQGAKDLVRPIRDGQKAAEVTVETEEYIIKRRWTQNGTPGTLAITDRENRRYTSPQKMLDDLIGNLSFDPLAFSMETPKAQAQMLAEIAGLSKPLADLDAKRVGHYADRTDTNREVKRLQGALETVAVPDGTPDEPIDLTQFSDRLVAAERERNQQNIAFKDLASLRQNEGDLRNQLTELSAKVIAVQNQLRKTLDDLALAQKEVEGFTEPDDETIRQDMATAQETNRLVEQKKQTESTRRALKNAQARSDASTKAIEARDAEKLRLVREAKFPVEGLCLGDEGVLYDGIPFAQTCLSGKLRVGIAMAMANNPKLRVIRAKDASLLDANNMAVIEDMADEHDFQVWLEVVSTDKGVGIRIEEGQVCTESAPA